MNFSQLEANDVLLWGLGREGWSVLRALELRRIQPNLTVFTDAPLSAQEERSLEDFNARSGIRLRAISGDPNTALRHSRVAIKSPGVSLYRPELTDFAARGGVITSSTSLWFAEKPSGTIIVVTGTKGKSTTSSILARLLESTGAKVNLGGNIGTPLLDFLEPRSSLRDDATQYWVVELSSYQIADAEMTPDITVLLNLYPEHVDWHGSVERYFRDKLRILELASDNTLSIINRSDARLAEARPPRGRLAYYNDKSGFHIDGGAFSVAERSLFPTSIFPLFGEHNLENVCAALAVFSACGFNPRDYGPALKTMRALPHRLSLIADREGVSYVDDSISTVPQSALAAFAAFKNRSITALLGGFERAQDWDELAAGVLSHGVARVITLPDSGPKVAAALRRRFAEGASEIPVYESKGLEDAVEHAAKSTPAGGVVLLSPAAPSYGHFKNFEARGDRFRELVEAL